MTEQNTNIWFNDPTVLLKKNQINKFWPTKNMSSNEKVNAITRLVIILTILGFIVTQSYNFFLLD